MTRYAAGIRYTREGIARTWNLEAVHAELRAARAHLEDYAAGGSARSDALAKAVRELAYATEDLAKAVTGERDEPVEGGPGPDWTPDALLTCAHTVPGTCDFCPTEDGGV